MQTISNWDILHASKKPHSFAIELSCLRNIYGKVKIDKVMTNVIILGDKGYLEKMLVNLVKNSIIYGNKNGRTVINAKKVGDRITINVVDNGIGISDADLPHVFERFYRADKYYSSDGKSIGLGLAIVKWIAEIHGGIVDVKQLPKGSVFGVTLPLNKAHTLHKKHN